MEELDIVLITRRSIQGVFALVTRTFFIQLIQFSVNLLLPLFLSPEVFGVYFLVTAVIAFLQYFSDIGLAAALVQKKEKLTDDDLSTTFTIQQILVIIVVVVSLLLSGRITSFYHLDVSGEHLFQALIVAFFLSSLKTIPSIILERDLRFEKLILPQIIETLFFNVTVLVLAMKGQGISSFTYAVLARGFAGLITMYLIAPWKMRLGITKGVAKRLLSFGIPFQMNSFLALIKDDLLIAYIGRILPLAEVGYIGFAQKYALAPLRLIMDNIIRITFPSFSRLQHERKALTTALEKSLFSATLFIFPSLAGMVVLAPYILGFIPRLHKWEPALLSLGFFAINSALSSISTPLINALNAIGKIKTTLYFMVFWTVVTWVLTPLCIVWFGFNGFAIASAIISFSVIAVVYVARKYMPFGLLHSVFYPFIAASVMGIFLYYVSPIVIHGVIWLFLVTGMGALLYLGIVFLFSGKQVKEDITTIILYMKK